MKTQTIIVALCLAACRGETPTAPSDRPAVTSLKVTSDSGDWVGQGQTYQYTLANASWVARLKPYSTGPYLDITVLTPAGTTPFGAWQLALAPRRGQAISVGAYDNAVGWPLQTDTQPGVWFAGNGRGCNLLTGKFAISELTIAADSSITRLRATFEQHCDGGSPALHGEIVIIADPWR